MDFQEGVRKERVGNYMRPPQMWNRNRGVDLSKSSRCDEGRKVLSDCGWWQTDTPGNHELVSAWSDIVFPGEVHLAVGLQPLSARPAAGTWSGSERRLSRASGMRWAGGGQSRAPAPGPVPSSATPVARPHCLWGRWGSVSPFPVALAYNVDINPSSASVMLTLTIDP